MEKIDNFKRDLEQERIPIEYLKNYFFPYVEKNLNYSVQYIEDINTQLEGIDIVLEKNNIKGNIDVKAQMNNYINNPIPTFCFELFYIKNNICKTGWFLRNDLKTNTYMFVWIIKSKYLIENNNKILTGYNDIEKIEIMTINKIDIERYFENIGLRKDILFNIENILGNNTKIYYDIYGKNFSYNKSMISFSKSIFLPENPINVVVNKKILKEICATHYFVSKNIIEIKKESYLNKNIILKTA